MGAIQTSLYLVAVALCIFSTGLTTRRAGGGAPLRFFTGYLVIQSAAFVFELLIAHPAMPLKSLWLGLLMSSSLLVAPCLWLAFRESIGGERPKLAELSRGHWITIAAGCLFTLPLMQTAHLGTTFYNPAHPVSWLHSRAIHTAMLLCIGIFVVQVPWYLIRCRKIVLENLAGRRRHWAQWPLAIVFTTWALAILRTLDCAFFKSPPFFMVVVAVISVSVTVGSLYLLLRQFGTAERGAQDRYAKSPLGTPIRQRIRRKLEATLGEGAIYKRSDLSLRALSEALNENPHYVSQVISQELNTSFYDLVNRYRIEQAKRLLREAPDETVLSIAMNVGFNSKSAFHAAFRRCTGATPSDFRGSSTH
ncbi:MAG TPA: helix-turn-helix transcriptional regulator [Steroidobacteraceae bacterium]|jgi:AraC-like DNA-binding protein|nr:helix-turn-helix transcriptional regulator [Steroidobacteraceae bacterium]